MAKVELSYQYRSRAEYVARLYAADIQWIFENKGLKATAFHLGIAVGAEVNLDETHPDGIPAFVLQQLKPSAKSIVKHTDDEHVNEFRRGFVKQYSEWKANRTPELAYQDWVNSLNL
jgi:hypothetical protein